MMKCVCVWGEGGDVICSALGSRLSIGNLQVQASGGICSYMDGCVLYIGRSLQEKERFCLIAVRCIKLFIVHQESKRVEAWEDI
jgi:hypothetical protein